ncbi:MAG TPA: hypothetical protein VGD27_18185 [Longimicrobiales bacterium]
MSPAASNQKGGWLRRAVLNGALLLFSFVVAVGLAEIAVRIAAPQQLIILRPDLWQPADTIGWLRRPNVDASINTGQGEVRLIADHEGFRVGPQGRVNGTPVLFLGDSFVEALQVEYEESVTGLLEKSLTLATGSSVAVRNAGTGGWSPNHYYLRARTLLPREPYRLVITAVFVGNDVQPKREQYFAPRAPAERHRFHWPRNLSKAELMSATVHPLNDMLEERSHLFVLLRGRLETLRMKTGTYPLYFPQEFLRAQANSDSWGVTADICRDISELAAKHDARALFVLIPADFQVNEAKFDQYVRGFGIDTATVDLEQPTRRLSEELAARDLTFVDALPRFRELNARGESLYGHVDPHLSPAGHKALADLITPVAARLLQEN